MAKRKTNTQPFWRLLFVIYLGIMVWLLFFRSRGVPEGYTYTQALKANMNLKPFYTIDNYMSVILRRPDSPYFNKCLTELSGNILLFVPAGWLLPKIFKQMQRFFPFVATCLLSIVFVETFQLFTLLGHFDVDDIILNLFGMMIGYIFYICTHKK